MEYYEIKKNNKVNDPIIIRYRVDINQHVIKCGFLA
jgi:hypothetical protein